MHCAPAWHTLRSVSIFTVFTVPSPLLLSHGGDEITYESSTLSRVSEAYAVVSSLSDRAMLKLSSSEEVDVSNDVYKI